MSDTMSVLTFRFDEGEDADHPNTTILIDGRDQIAEADDLIGFDPADILLSDALVAQPVPRRIAIYRCSCGTAGCACAAAIIRRDGDLVRWEDFRDFVGVYGRPTVDHEPSGGTPLSLPTFTFELAQYQDAIEVAANDSSWKTRARVLAGRLMERLVQTGPDWLPAGWRVGWVSTGWRNSDGVQIELRNPNGQLIVEAPWDLDLPDATVVEEAARTLESRHRRRWKVVADHNWQAPPQA